MTRRTDIAEAQEIEAMLERERQREPHYPLPIVERPESAQLAKTIIDFTQFDSEGTYIETKTTEAER